MDFAPTRTSTNFANVDFDIDRASLRLEQLRPVVENSEAEETCDVMLLPPAIKEKGTPRKSGLQAPFSMQQKIAMTTVLSDGLLYALLIAPSADGLVTVLFYLLWLTVCALGLALMAIDPSAENHRWMRIRRYFRLEGKTGCPSVQSYLNLGPDPNDDFDDGDMWCRHCDHSVKPHTKHCGDCNKCVPYFDHHCPWLNTCIGGHNYDMFCSTVISVFWMMVFLLSGASQAIMPYRLASFGVILIFVLNLLFTLLVTTLMSIHGYLICKGITTWDLVLWMREQKRSEIGPGLHMLYVFFQVDLPEDRVDELHGASDEDFMGGGQLQFEMDARSNSNSDAGGMWGGEAASSSSGSWRGGRDSPSSNTQRERSQSMLSMNSISSNVLKNVGGFLVGSPGISQPRPSRGCKSQGAPIARHSLSLHISHQVFHKDGARSEGGTPRDLAHLTGEGLFQQGLGFRMPSRESRDLQRIVTSYDKIDDARVAAVSQHTHGENDTEIHKPLLAEEPENRVLRHEEISGPQEEQVRREGEVARVVEEKPWNEDAPRLCADSVGIDSIDQGETGGACTTAPREESMDTVCRQEDSTGGTNGVAVKELVTSSVEPVRNQQLARDSRHDWLRACGKVCQPCSR